MPDQNADDIRNFVERVLEMQTEEQDEPRLDDVELEAMAARYGLSAEAWQDLLQRRSEHLRRGRSLIEGKAWNEAIAELSAARELGPQDPDILAALGDAFLGRAGEAGDLADREQAKKFFRRALTFDPAHQPAIRGLSRLERQIGSASRRRVSSRKLVLTAGLMAILLVALVLIRQKPEDPAEPLRGGEQATPEAPPGEATEAVTGDASAEEFEIPLVLGPELADFQLRTESSTLTRYQDSYGYRLKAILSVGELELHSLKAELELLDSTATLVADRLAVDALPDYAASLLPGDTLPIDALVFEQRSAPQVHSARLVLSHIDSRPMTGEVEQGRLIPWTPGDSAFPANAMVEIRERSARRTDGGMLEKEASKFEVVFEIENVGRRSISGLEIRIELLGHDDSPLRVERSSIVERMAASGLELNAVGVVTIARGSEARFEPGDRRVEKATLIVPGKLPTDIGEYLVSLVAIEL